MNLNYCLMVTKPGYGHQLTSSALQFAWALLESNHHLGVVFFYQDGIHNANRFSTPSSDEVDLVRSWYSLTKKQVTLHVCVAAALRRGVVDTFHASLLKYSGDNLQVGFKLSSLGQLAKAIMECDRFIQF